MAGEFLKLALSGPFIDILGIDVGEPLKDELNAQEKLRRRELHGIIKEMKKKYLEASK